MSELINIEVLEPTPVPMIEIHVDLNAAQSAIDAAAQAQLILEQIQEFVLYQNNYVRNLVINENSLIGSGSMEEKICAYILNLPEDERTIAETDSKWNIVIVDDYLEGRIHSSVYNEVYN